jgi:hypothetical protein
MNFFVKNLAKRPEKKYFYGFAGRAQVLPNKAEGGLKCSSRNNLKSVKNQWL